MMVTSAPIQPRLAQPAVHIDRVSKSYRRGTTLTKVLDEVDLTIPRGQFAFLVGPSGSGKTTLLSILGCILSADRGSVRILDENTTSLSDTARADLRRNRIGFVFQRFHLIRGLSAAANIAVPLTLRGMSARRSRRRAMSLLEAVGLADKANAHPANMSAGQCQRVALARALAGDPELILADEPTASLDAANGAEIMRLLRRLTEDKSKTVIVVTHDQRILPFADSIYRVDNGRVAEVDEAGSSLTLANNG